MWSGLQMIVSAVFALILAEQYNVGALINDRCDPSNQMDCRIPNALCQPFGDQLYGLCKCSVGYKKSLDERACNAELGKKTCLRDSDCDVSNTRCDERGRCTCRRTHMVSHDRTTCLPPLGRICQESSDCSDLVPDSRCIRGVCGCRDPFLTSSDHTTCLPVLGQRCHVTSDCMVKDSYCDNGLCACVRASHVPSNNKTICLPLVTKILAPCDQDDQCMNEVLGQHTQCRNAECTCRYGITRANEACDDRKELDDWCTHNQQCQMIERASCVQNRCSCDPFYVPFASNRSVCIRIALLYASACVDQVQCTAGFGDGASCVDGACRCLRDHHFVMNETGKCVTNRGLGERCTTNECFFTLDREDRQNIRCVDDVCACKEGTVPSQENNSCAGASSIYDWKMASLIFLLASVLSLTSLRSNHKYFI